MSAPVRFLVTLVAGWVAVRAMTLGAVPGFTVGHARPVPPSSLPPIAATSFPPLDPVEAYVPQPSYPYPYPQAWAPPMPPRMAYYVPYAAAPPPASMPSGRPPWQLASAAAAPVFTSPIAPLDQWDLASLAPLPVRRSSPVPAVLAQAPGRPLDRLQLTSWTMLRGDPSPGALADGGTLGGSQAGARLTYAFDRRFAASLRTSSPIGGSRGAEVAAGLRVTPFPAIPIAFTAERRQSISPHGGGRSAFALFAEGGLYRQPLPWRFDLDAYFQAGVVGFNRRDLFADGAIAFTRPVYGRFSAGFGAWGGVQPGLYRVDAGPRVSVRLRDNIRAHVDWRQRLAGSAEPKSGPVLTLAADF